jgi:hypothetical protein
MSFQNYITVKSPYLMFPGLHGAFTELHGIQLCDSRNIKMNVDVFLELHGIFPELHC